MIPAEAVEAAAKVIYSDGWDGTPYWESMADDNSDKVHHRAIAQNALEAAAPHMLAGALPRERDEARYVDISDPMWEEHQRTVSPKCTCEYTKIQNGLWKTIAIRRDPDKDCAAHE